jgi:hypothetical protein
MATFLASIGIPVLAADLPDRCFVPGIRLERGRLLVDEARMPCPGDLLHEGGHVAVMTPAKRAGKAVDASDNMGDEIAAIAWSWAALTHLGVAPEVVFHPQGYKGASPWLIETFSAGNYPGLPLLQWMGLALDGPTAADRGVAPFPHMLRWLRDEPRQEPAGAAGSTGSLTLK